MDLKLKPANECTFDAVSLGEVMLRLDPARNVSAPQELSDRRNQKNLP